MNRRMLRAVLLLLLCMALTLSALAAQLPDVPSIYAAEKTQLGLKERDTVLDQAALVPAGSSASDWLAMTLARAGVPERYGAYLDTLRTYVEQQYAENGGLDRIRSTEWQRIALTVLALGGDPTQFGTGPDGAPIDLIADGTYGWQGENAPDLQGVNADIFALLTLDAAGCEVPADARYPRSYFEQNLLAAQLPDGGFGLSAGGEMDVDMTAMAVQALAPQQAQYAAQIEAALAALSAAQLPDGTFASWDTPNAESTAQVVLALCCLGIDPETDARFVKNGKTVLDGLSVFLLPEGVFTHAAENQPNLMATEQAMRALTALDRLRAGQSSYFAMADAAVTEPAPRRTVWPWAAGAAVLAAAALAAVLLRKKPKS